MMRTHKLWRGLAAAAVLATALLIGAIQASASTALKMDLDSLVANSDRIVVGQVVSMRSFWEDGRIYTDTTLEVLENWKGDERKTVRVRQLGGRVGDMTTKVSGLARFQAGERALVFLENAGREAFIVTGLAQGKFRVALGPDGQTRFAIPQVDHLQLVEPNTTSDEDEGQTEDAVSKDVDSTLPGASPAELLRRGAKLRRALPSDIHSGILPIDTLRQKVRTLVPEKREDDR